MTDENAKPAESQEQTEKREITEKVKPEVKIPVVTPAKWKRLLEDLSCEVTDLSSETQEQINSYSYNNRQLQKFIEEMKKAESSENEKSAKITIENRTYKFKRLDAANRALDNQICDAIKLEYKEAHEEPEDKPEVKPEVKPEETIVEKKEVKPEEQPPVETRRRRIGLFRLRR